MVLKKYHNGPVIQTDEYAPQTTPAIKVNANSLIEVTPIIYNTSTITKVVKEEYMVLVTMRISPDAKRVSCNLKAPIVINPKTLPGCQVIAENEEYPIHYYLSDVVDQVKESAGE